MCLLTGSGTLLDCLVQSFDQGLIGTMRSHIGDHSSSDGETKQVEISEQIQYLVAYEFVGITKLRIYDLAFMHDDMGIEVATSHLSKPLGQIDIFEGIK